MTLDEVKVASYSTETGRRIKSMDMVNVLPLLCKDNVNYDQMGVNKF